MTSVTCCTKMASAFTKPSLRLPGKLQTQSPNNRGNQRCHLLTECDSRKSRYVSSTGQEAWIDDFLATLPALCVLQLNVEVLSTVKCLKMYTTADWIIPQGTEQSTQLTENYSTWQMKGNVLLHCTRRFRRTNKIRTVSLNVYPFHSSS